MLTLVADCPTARWRCSLLPLAARTVPRMKTVNADSKQKEPRESYFGG